ncbi:two-component sensor histidine kinase [Dinghuibacter silviterrae]|uniref:histidine kinase n=1 Tax=Dinghuibacter silviterrae TaxID=1539049 RepID=A0A4R8DFD0_9BACT|nr:two-component sensor histidine kinase [Dinghuibacter silviterrae]
MFLKAQTDTVFRSDTARARALLRESNAFRAKGDYAQGLDRCLQAEKIMASLRPDHLMGMCWVNIANVYQEMEGEGRTEVYVDKGISYCRMAYAYFDGTRDTSGLISSLNQMGVLFRDKARNFNHDWYYDTAFDEYLQALRLIDLSGKGVDSRAKLYNNISQVYLEHKNNLDSALAYLFMAVKANEAQKYPLGLTYNYGNIAHVYRNKHDYRQALVYARKMLGTARGLRQPERELNGLFEMYEVFRDAGRSDSALTYYISANQLNDSLTNIAKTRQVSELQTKYETAKKEAEIGRLRTERSAQNKEIVSLIATALLLGGLAAWMITLYNRVRKQGRQIAEQSTRLEVMMKELHHRVKNNLQVVSSLLSLQSYDVQDERASAALRESRQRVEAMSLIHQRLYNRDALTTVNLQEYLSDLAESLLASYGFERDTFDLDVSVHPEWLDVDKALPIGLIINEMVTNALKYAYPGIARPSLQIRITEEPLRLVCQVRDNGVGIDLDRWKQKTSSFGKQLITALCKQLRAEQTLVVDGGTAFTLTIPKQAA